MRLLSLCQAFNAWINPMGCPLNGRDEAALHRHTHTQQPGKQAHKLHVRTQTHRDQPVLSCQSEPRPSIKMTVGQTGTRQRAFDFSSDKRVQETFSPHEWGNRKGKEWKNCPFGALRSSNFLSSRRRPSFPSAALSRAPSSCTGRKTLNRLDGLPSNL